MKFPNAPEAEKYLGQNLPQGLETGLIIHLMKIIPMLYVPCFHMPVHLYFRVVAHQLPNFRNEESTDRLEIIDTHIHLYDTNRSQGVDWPPVYGQGFVPSGSYGTLR